MRLGKEYEEMYLKVNGEDIGKDNTITKRITKEINKQSKDRWQAKVQHGYMFKKAWQKESTDVTTSNLWLKMVNYHHIQRDSHLPCKNRK